MLQKQRAVNKKKKPVVRQYISGEPEPMDILCGSKRRSYVTHPGSKRFTSIVETYQQLYNQALSKYEKSTIIRRIAEDALENGARFLMKEAKFDRWYLLTNRGILDKIGHALRFESLKPKSKLDQIECLPCDEASASSLSRSDLAAVLPPPLSTVASISERRPKLTKCNAIHETSDTHVRLTHNRSSDPFEEFVNSWETDEESTTPHNNSQCLVSNAPLMFHHAKANCRMLGDEDDLCDAQSAINYALTVSDQSSRNVGCSQEIDEACSEPDDDANTTWMESLASLVNTGDVSDSIEPISMEDW